MIFNDLFKVPVGSQDFLKQVLYLGGIGVSFPNDPESRTFFEQNIESLMIMLIPKMSKNSLEHLYKETMTIRRDIDLIKLYNEIDKIFYDLSQAPKFQNLMIAKNLDDIFRYFMDSEKYSLSLVGGKLLKVVEADNKKYLYIPKRKNTGFFNIHYFEKIEDVRENI